jgi:hypothetical protein
MVDHDLNLARLESLQKANGKHVPQANLETV